jgi:hypothetical protein
MCDCPQSVRDADLDTVQGQIAALAPYLAAAAKDVLLGNTGASPAGVVGGALIMVEDSFAEYGRNLFDISDDQLAFELRRELEDATVYRAEQLRRLALK